MPIYEYRCNHCNQSCEFLQKLSDSPMTKCPHCGENSLKKQVSNPSFRLAGTGWYETDFKDKPNPAKTKNTSDSSDSSTN